MSPPAPEAGGAIIINSGKPAAQLRPLLKGYEGRVFTIDAGTISRKHLGAYFPNTPHAGRRGGGEPLWTRRTF